MALFEQSDRFSVKKIHNPRYRVYSLPSVLAERIRRYQNVWPELTIKRTFICQNVEYTLNVFAEEACVSSVGLKMLFVYADINMEWPDGCEVSLHHRELISLSCRRLIHPC